MIELRQHFPSLGLDFPEILDQTGVIQPVTPQSIAQASRAMKAHETVASHSLLPPSRQAITSHPAVHNARVEAATVQAFKAFVAAKRDKIEAIDALLKKGGP